MFSMLDRRNPIEAEQLQEFKASLPEEIFFKTMIPFEEVIEKASNRSFPVALMPDSQQTNKYYIDFALELKQRELAQRGGDVDEQTTGLF